MKWNQLISGLLLLTLAFTGIEVQGQSKLRGVWETRSAEYDDTYLLYVGILVQYSFSRYALEKAPGWNSSQIVNATGSPTHFTDITNPGGHEIGVGVPVRIRLNHYWSISSGVTWSFERGQYTRSDSEGTGPRIKYHIDNPSATYLRMQKGNNSEGENFPIMEVPLHIKLHSDYKHFSRSPHPYRLYLLAGTKYNHHINAKTYYDNLQNFEKSDPPIVLKKKHWNVEAGLGVDFYFTYFKMSVETRFSQSIGDLLDHSRHDDIQARFDSDGKNFPNHYMDALSKVGLRGWQFSIILE